MLVSYSFIFQITVLTILCLFVTVYVIGKYSNKNSNENSNKKRESIPKKIVDKYPLKFNKKDDVIQRLNKIELAHENVSFMIWKEFDKMFKDKKQRKLGLYCLEQIILKVTSDKQIKKLKKQHKILQSKKKNIYKSKNKAKGMKQYCNYKNMMTSNKNKERNKKIFQIYNPNKIFKDNDIKFTMDKSLQNELRLKHLVYLWDKLTDRITDKGMNCVICQFDINDDLPMKLDCCGIELHYECQIDYIKSKTDGKGIEINLNNLGCVICKQKMDHSELDHVFKPMNELRHKMINKYKKRLKFDDRNEADIEYAMKKYLYFKCYKCSEPYFGGLNMCQNQNNNEIPEEKRLCPKCDEIKGHPTTCDKHGDTYIQWKCKFCCSVATWDCGCTHFCELCHVKCGELWGMDLKDLIQCPAICDKKTYLPKKIDLETCPLGINHPPHGDEYCLGCAECRRLENESKDDDDDDLDDSKENSEVMNKINDDSDDTDDIEPEYEHKNDNINIINDDDRESSAPVPDWLLHNDNDSEYDESSAAVPNWLLHDNNNDSEYEESSAAVPNWLLHDNNDDTEYNESSDAVPNWLLHDNNDDSEYSESSADVPGWLLHNDNDSEYDESTQESSDDY